MDLSSLTTDLTQDEINSWYEAVGAIVITHTQMDLQIARLVGSFCGLHQSLAARHLIYTIGAVDKARTLHAIASTFKSDPHNQVENYEPIPELYGDLKRIAQDFDEHSKVRNVVCHGTLGKINNRLFIGSASAPQFFRNDGGAGAWVYLDEAADHVARMYSTLRKSTELQKRLAGIHDQNSSPRREP